MHNKAYRFGVENSQQASPALASYLLARRRFCGKMRRSSFSTCGKVGGQCLGAIASVPRLASCTFFPCGTKFAAVDVSGCYSWHACMLNRITCIMHLHLHLQLRWAIPYRKLFYPDIAPGLLINRWMATVTISFVSPGSLLPRLWQPRRSNRGHGQTQQTSIAIGNVVKPHHRMGGFSVIIQRVCRFYKPNHG